MAVEERRIGVIEKRPGGAVSAELAPAAAFRGAGANTGRDHRIQGDIDDLARFANGPADADLQPVVAGGRVSVWR